MRGLLPVEILRRHVLSGRFGKRISCNVGETRGRLIGPCVGSVPCETDVMQAVGRDCLDAQAHLDHVTGVHNRIGY